MLENRQHTFSVVLLSSQVSTTNVQVTCLFLQQLLPKSFLEKQLKMSTTAYAYFVGLWALNLLMKSSLPTMLLYMYSPSQVLNTVIILSIIIIYKSITNMT
jgi:hypothetical protein